MAYYERVKPFDTFLNDITREFESGRDRGRDRELDEMIWELGDYENEEPLMEVLEFGEEAPVEEELSEKKLRPSHGKTPFKHVKKNGRKRAAAGAAR
ncbi:MAG: hypothetical protein ACLP9S_18355 [Syntrophales bacterium]|jgi:hypothetical protein